jgi:hypothetical protein
MLATDLKSANSPGPCNFVLENSKNIGCNYKTTPPFSRQGSKQKKMRLTAAWYRNAFEPLDCSTTHAEEYLQIYDG